MNKLIIIGNGFDLAHGLNTKYSDMIDFFWENFFLSAVTLNNNRNYRENTFDSELYKLNRKAVSPYDLLAVKNNVGLKEAKRYLRSAQDYQIKGDFFRSILEIQDIKNWVDVENEYYKTLVDNLHQSNKSRNIDELKELNKNFESIKKLLCEHLVNEQNRNIKLNEKVFENIIKTPEKEGFSMSSDSDSRFEKILLLNFNYTNTLEKYYLDKLKTTLDKKFVSVEIIHIHGDITRFDLNPMIFGYGDELDKHSKDIVDFNDSEFLKNIKSINYQFSSNYKSVLQFLSLSKFQAVIMGHSCGNSDRTLLNTIFEHENCSSIKPYYHAWEGGDNYFDIVCNIYRNFTKNHSFREKVVEKNLCETLT